MTGRAAVLLTIFAVTLTNRESKHLLFFKSLCQKPAMPGGSSGQWFDLNVPGARARKRSRSHSFDGFLNAREI